MYALFAVPSSTTFVADASSWIGGLSGDFLTIAAVIAGILLIGMLASGLLGTVVRSFGKLVGRGRGGRRGRRR